MSRRNPETNFTELFLAEKRDIFEVKNKMFVCISEIVEMTTPRGTLRLRSGQAPLKNILFILVSTKSLSFSWNAGVDG